MADTEELIAKRKKAYVFIVENAKTKVLLPNINSDGALAKALCRPEEQREAGIYVEKEIEFMYANLVALKEGTDNPSSRLIEGVRSFFGPTIPDFEIDSHLVDPFK